MFLAVDDSQKRSTMTLSEMSHSDSEKKIVSSFCRSTPLSIHLRAWALKCSVRAVPNCSASSLRFTPSRVRSETIIYSS